MDLSNWFSDVAKNRWLKKPVRQNEMKSEVSHKKFAFELFFWIQNLVGQHLVDGLHIKFFFINV